MRMQSLRYVTETMSEREIKTNWTKVLEPQKCGGWYWKTWDDLKEILAGAEKGGEKLFLPLVNLLGQTNDLESLRS
jgi:hypothetical protein